MRKGQERILDFGLLKTPAFLHVLVLLLDLCMMIIDGND